VADRPAPCPERVTFVVTGALPHDIGKLEA
jgi:hypothetical protein